MGSFAQVARVVQQFSYVPQELRLYPHWVTWKLTPQPKQKIPFNPAELRYPLLASPTDPTTWGSYQQALQQYSMEWSRGYLDGIGFVFSQDCPYSFIDLDHCLEGGKFNQVAQDTMARFPEAYAEISPSGSGLKLVLKGKLPNGSKRKGGIECYDKGRYSTLTGQALVVPHRLIDCQGELSEWYLETFPATSNPSPLVLDETSPSLIDSYVLKLARHRPKFDELWQGNKDEYPSASEADMAFFGILACYTQDSEQVERIARKSGLVRDKWNDHPTYLNDTIEKAILNRGFTYQPKTDRRELIELPTHGLILSDVRQQFKERLAFSNEAVMLYNSPCGTGKSHITAEQVANKNVAWIAETHNMVTQVPALAKYNHVQPCSSENCSDSKTHEELIKLGYSTYQLHRDHDCEYIRQFDKKGSAIYMREYAQTHYPSNYDAIVIDEFNPLAWFTTRVISRQNILAVRRSTLRDERADILLKAFLDVMSDAPLYGKRLYDRLASQVGGTDAFLALVFTLASDEQVMTTHPRPRTAIEKLPPVIVPHIVGVLRDEIKCWDGGNEFNSCMRIDHDEHIRIVQPRRFQGNTPTIILDATGDNAIIGRLLGRGIETVRYEVQPPSGMRHIAVRTRKPYGKGALLDLPSSEQAFKRLVKELRYLLKDTDIGTVGLITFMGIEERLAKVLGIPKKHTGHFYNIRGSNAFQECETLVVVGTPCPNLNEVEWLARMLYQDDPKPIFTDKDEHHRYLDVRLKGLLEYLIKAELTQAAHRNRPLVYEGRRVISLCNAEVDFLPVTERITQLPNLPRD